MKRATLLGTRTSASQRLAIAGPNQFESQGEAEIRNEREWMRGVDRERRQHGKDVQQEMVFEPFALDLRDLRASTMTIPSGGKVGAQIAPAFQLLGNQEDNALADFFELLGRGQPLLRSGRRRSVSGHADLRRAP